MTVTAPRNPMPRPLQSLGWTFRSTPFLLRQHARFGDTWKMRVGHEPEWTLLAHPDMVRDVFTASPDALRAGEANASALEPVLGPASVLTADGRSHLRQRRMLLPPFHGEALAGYRETMRELAEAEVGSWRPGESFAAQPRMARLTLDIIVRTVFGADAGREVDGIRAALRAMLEEISRPIGFVAFMALGERAAKLAGWKEVLGAVDRELYALIARRRADEHLGDRRDVLSLLLAARDEDGDGLTDSELRDELVTLLVAGHETTATSLAWAIERLVRDPARLGRLRDEAAAGDATFARAVCHETLRLRPVIPIVVRRVHEELEAGGVSLRPGDTAVPAITVIHRREDLYPDPHRWLPERFVGVKPGTYTWIPFGGGTRRCLGASFALLEMEEVLGAVGRARMLRPLRDDAGERAGRRSITIAPRRGAEVIAA